MRILPDGCGLWRTSWKSGLLHTRRRRRQYDFTCLRDRKLLFIIFAASRPDSELFYASLRRNKRSYVGSNKEIFEMSMS